MNLKEKLAEVQAKLAALKAHIEADDAEAIAEAEKLAAEAENLEAQIAAAEKKAALLAKMGNAAPAPAKTEPEPAATIGDAVAQAVEAKGWQLGEKNSVMAFKDGAVVQTTPSSIKPALTTIDTNLVTGYARPLIVEDLLGSETISGTALTYFVEGATLTGDFAAVAENGTKPQFSYSDPTAVTESLVKIAAYYKESDELVSDAPWLASNINSRGLYRHALVRENQLLNGNGTGGNIKGLLNRDGVQALTYAKGSTLDADTIFTAITKVQTATGMTADAIVINPADYQRLRLAKDSNNQYYGGGYFYGAYGNTGIAEQPAIWGLRTVVSAAIEAGTCLVGAFKQGASVISKGGVNVEVANTNEDDFINNRVTVRIESRLALAVRYPAAFVKITEAAS